MSTEKKLLQDIASGKGLKPIKEERLPGEGDNSPVGNPSPGIRFENFAKQENAKDHNESEKGN